MASVSIYHPPLVTLPPWSSVAILSSGNNVTCELVYLLSSKERNVFRINNIIMSFGVFYQFTEESLYSVSNQCLYSDVFLTCFVISFQIKFSDLRYL